MPTSSLAPPAPPVDPGRVKPAGNTSVFLAFNNQAGTVAFGPDGGVLVLTHTAAGFFLPDGTPISTTSFGVISITFDWTGNAISFYVIDIANDV